MIRLCVIFFFFKQKTAYEMLRSLVGSEMCIRDSVKASMFSYLVTGLQDSPVFMSQVELARRLGMNEPDILSRLIPVQKRWHEEFLSSESLQTRYPVHYIIPLRDELTAWLSEQASIGM